MGDPTPRRRGRAGAQPGARTGALADALADAELLPGQTADDRPEPAPGDPEGSAARIRRLLEEVPPHHVPR